MTGSPGKSGRFHREPPESGAFPRTRRGTGLATAIRVKSPWNKGGTGGSARTARCAGTKVTVVEEKGELVAIVVDKTRGVVRIPLGSIDPSDYRFP